MENLYLISTNRPSRLVLDTVNENLFLTTTENLKRNNMNNSDHVFLGASMIFLAVICIATIWNLETQIKTWEKKEKEKAQE